MQIYDFTIIVPLYNEEDNMPELERRLSAYLDTCSMKACVLFVDDGSSDGSLDCLKAMCSRHGNFRYISFGHNCGLSAALKAGFDYADSPYIGYIDADLQTYPEDFEKLLPYIREYDMVTGIRVVRGDTVFKKFQSKFANSFRRMMTGDGASDTGCPLKVFRTHAARRFPVFKGMHRFFPALLLLQNGARYKEVPVRHCRRVAGSSKFSLWNRMIPAFVDCLGYRWMKSRYIEYEVTSAGSGCPEDNGGTAI